MDEKQVGLWAALANAQGKIQEPKYDKENPFFKKADGTLSRYASLTSVWAAIRAPFSSEGLSIVQGLKNLDNGKLSLITTLTHKSGEKEIFECPVFTDKNGMQALGSAITYARRYSLNCIAGTSGEEDDDGNGADGKDSDKNKKNENQNQGNQRPSYDDHQKNKQQAEGPKVITAEQLKRLWAIAGECGYDHDAVHNVLRPAGIESTKDLPQARYEDFLKYMQKNKIKGPQ